jgi:photosystem II stability/assembly factor-like uncharacterized protein
MKNKSSLMRLNLLIFIIFSIFTSVFAKDTDTIPEKIYSGLKFRNLVPAFVSGRISDLAINPDNSSEYFVSVAAGGIWKTNNNGTTFNPVFDNYPVYSVGCLAIDQKNTKVIWAGTGENNHQRSVSYGDGVYKSVDGGKSWKNMGLKESYHIGRILIHPDNSDVVFVAAEGSVWGPGGERGLYKTEDGGKTWKKVLEISENTGVNNVEMDPVDHNIMYATSEQRRRRTQTRIGGGPESAVWKSTDGGNTWRKLIKGIPGVDKGGMSIIVSPINHNIVYLMVEAAMGKGGFFRSSDRGESWNKMSDYNTSGQYFGEIYPSPFDVNTVYSLETRSKYTTDGGKTWKNIGNNKRHVDDHAFWIDKKDKNHFMIGTDGGLYETFDGGKTYNHKLLPVTQFYRVGIDRAFPFYYVYGGTQDNSSLGAPSNTLYTDGISQCEWDITLGGDGFWQAVDQNNHNIVYSEYQYGNIYRYDKMSGERINIKPREAEGELLYKWNWNAPFVLSKHNPQRLYMAANYVFQSDDRGQSWKRISDDITTGKDRNSWKVMDRYWSVDGVAKDVSTSLYGTAVSLAESPVKEGLVFVGTDDGVLSITDDGGKTWKKINSFPNVPEYTYISDIEPSGFDANTVFVTFDNRKHFDFKPYILKSTNLGKSWTSITSDLPDKMPVHTIKQDFKNKDLLLLGTEFGFYFSNNAGENWIQLKAGLPTIAVRDIALHEGEEDIVIATFGRGFYILDNFEPLREISNEIIEKDFYMFPVKDVKLYVPRNRGGYGFGSVQHNDKNEPFGATFTYFVKETPKTLKQIRREKEKKLIKEKAKIPYPTLDELRKEDEEVKPYLIFSIKDENGNPVQRLTKNISKGINRLTWNLRYSNPSPIKLNQPKFDPLKKVNSGMLAFEGKYSVDVYRYIRGKIDTLSLNNQFNLVPLNITTLPPASKEELVQYMNKAVTLFRKSTMAQSEANELLLKIRNLKQAANSTPGSSAGLLKDIEKIEKKLTDIKWTFEGQKPPASMEERWPQPVPLNDRLYFLVYTHYNSTSPVTTAEKDALRILKKKIPSLIKQLIEIKEKDIPGIEKALDNLGAGWTPGRIED